MSEERARFCLILSPLTTTLYIFSEFLLTPLLRFTLVYNPLLGLSFVAVYWAIGLYHAYSVWLTTYKSFEIWHLTKGLPYPGRPSSQTDYNCHRTILLSPTIQYRYHMNLTNEVNIIHVIIFKIIRSHWFLSILPVFPFLYFPSFFRTKSTNCPLTFSVLLFFNEQIYFVNTFKGQFSITDLLRISSFTRANSESNMWGLVRQKTREKGKAQYVQYEREHWVTDE